MIFTRHRLIHFPRRPGGGRLRRPSEKAAQVAGHELPSRILNLSRQTSLTKDNTCADIIVRILTNKQTRCPWRIALENRRKQIALRVK